MNSIDEFEYHPEFGPRQLIELGFEVQDLLLASTDGAGVPLVIGPTEYATELQLNNLNEVKNYPYFLYCNPDNIMKETVTRPKKVLENSRVNMFVGPMMITGSTRI